MFLCIHVESIQVPKVHYDFARKQGSMCSRGGLIIGLAISYQLLTYIGNILSSDMGLVTCMKVYQ